MLRFDPTTASPHPDIAVGTMSYDTASRLASLAYTHLGAAIDTFGYGYDSLSRVSQFSSIDGTATYGYDPTSQLTSVVYAGGGHQPANESFQYDPNGNRTLANGATQVVAAGNLLTSDGTFNLFYDAEGNLVEKKRISTAPAGDYDTKQAWDYRNRLIDVWQYDNSGVLTKHEHLIYDPFDRLIGREIDSTGNGTFDHTEYYVYDGTDVALQFNGAGSLTNRYLNGPSPSGAEAVYAEEDLSSLTSPGNVTYPLTDQQGSGRDIVDSNGNLVDHSIFTAFGQTAFESNPAVHHLEGYAGGLPDPVTGEIHFGARNLDAVDAVWSSEDPIGLNGGDTNFRRYVGNSPTNAVDPSGLVLIAVDGTGSKAWRKKSSPDAGDPYISHVRNFYEDYDGAPGEQKFYWDGPDSTIVGAADDCGAIYRGVMAKLEKVLKKNPDEEINLVGHSRGGYIVMQVAWELKRRGYQVNFLGLYDAVDSAPGFGKSEKISSNVLYCAHAISSWRAHSRGYFNRADHGAEDASKMNDYSEREFIGTHAAIGGAPWQGDRPRGMTEKYDKTASEETDEWMRKKARAAGVEFDPFSDNE